MSGRPEVPPAIHLGVLEQAQNILKYGTTAHNETVEKVVFPVLTDLQLFI
jgi:hypothetical protein